ncbi:hypothetical protein D3C84_946690 [compost metagenome]
MHVQMLRGLLPGAVLLQEDPQRLLQLRALLLVVIGQRAEHAAMDARGLFQAAG